MASKPKPPVIQGDGFGLGVAQIVITCATPMIEEPEQPFPPPPPEEVIVEPPEEEPEVAEEEPQVLEPVAEEPEDPPDDQPADSAPFPISSSTGSEEDTYTGPSTAENSQAAPPPEEGGSGSRKGEGAGQRGSIPDELEPHQLAQLQDLKESNA